MKTFSCVCGNWIYFQNSVCENCGRILGFLPDHLAMSVIEPAGGNQFRAAHQAAENSLYRQCDNYRFEQVCNWLIEADDEAIYCRACRLNHMIPDLSISENRSRWYRIEDAKRRMLYTLLRLRLPVVGRDTDSQFGLSFDFLADPGVSQKVYTGHDNGLITINVAEADSSLREEFRESMGERYRTLLGHFRHEIGHYYWDKLIFRTHWLENFRASFGDDRANYDMCRNNHYANGCTPDWQSSFVTGYASMHPWEDWAETWAHYLHIVDTLETAANYQFSLRNVAITMPPLLVDPRPPEAHSQAAFKQQIIDWSHMTLAMNAVNRSMGMPDPYPFVLSNIVLDKLYFVHCVVAEAADCVSRDAVPQGTAEVVSAARSSG